MSSIAVIFDDATCHVAKAIGQLKILLQDLQNSISKPNGNPVISEDSVQKFYRNVSRDERYKKHRFPKEAIDEIRPYLEPNNIYGILEVLEDWLVIGTVIFISYNYHYYTSDFYYYYFIDVMLYLFAILVIGARHRALADILHQSSHGALAKNEYLNKILGTVFSGYTIFQSFSVYTNSHVKIHHPWLGNPYKDPDYIGYIDNKLCGDYRNSTNTIKFLLNIPSLKNSWIYLKYLLKHRILNENELEEERIFRIKYYLVVCILFYMFPLFFKLFLIYWLVSFLTTNVWIGSYLELLEHFPMLDGTSSYIDIYITKNRIGCFFSNFILGIHWEGYHLVHHLFPKVPSWNYKKIHNILIKYDNEYKNLDHGKKGFLHLTKSMIKEANEKKWMNPKKL